MAAGDKSLWLLHPCPPRRKRRRTKSFLCHLWGAWLPPCPTSATRTHITHPAPHHPPCPTPPAALVPPPQQEMRTGFFALLADVGDHSRATSCPPGTTCPPGAMARRSHHPVCTQTVPHPATRPSPACEEGTAGLGGRATSIGTSPASPCPACILAAGSPREGLSHR